MSRMENILDKADKLFRSGSSEEIQSFLPEIVATYCKLDDMNAYNETNLDKIRIAEYIRLKKQKKEWGNSYSDKDIEVIAKNKALSTYDQLEVDKKTVAHIKLYIDQLTQRKIDLAVQNKNLTAGVSL